MPVYVELTGISYIASFMKNYLLLPVLIGLLSACSSDDIKYDVVPSIVITPKNDKLYYYADGNIHSTPSDKISGKSLFSPSSGSYNDYKLSPDGTKIAWSSRYYIEWYDLIKREIFKEYTPNSIGEFGWITDNSFFYISKSGSSQAVSHKLELIGPTAGPFQYYPQQQWWSTDSIYLDVQNTRQYSSYNKNTKVLSFYSAGVVRNELKNVLSRPVASITGDTIACLVQNTDKTTRIIMYLPILSKELKSFNNLKGYEILFSPKGDEILIDGKIYNLLDSKFNRTPAEYSSNFIGWR